MNSQEVIRGYGLELDMRDLYMCLSGMGFRDSDFPMEDEGDYAIYEYAADFLSKRGIQLCPIYYYSGMVYHLNREASEGPAMYDMEPFVFIPLSEDDVANASLDEVVPHIRQKYGIPASIDILNALVYLDGFEVY